MIPINLRLDGNLGMTLLSNAFIDNYMKYANDVEIKVYLYLLRNLSAGNNVDIASMADCFNYSEKDIIRALLYWERWGVLSLVYDSEKLAAGDDYTNRSETLTGIRLSPLQEGAAEPAERMPAHSVSRSAAVTAPVLASAVSSTVCAPAADTLTSAVSASTDTEDVTTPLFTGTAGTVTPGAVCVPAASVKVPSESEAVSIKASYSLDDMRAFRADASCSFLFTAAQQYLGKPLTDPQMRSLIYMTKELRFTPELTDYLLQHCIGNGHKDFRYIEATAAAWAEQGISTPEEARIMTRCEKDDDAIREIMNMLGRSGTPAPQELRFIRRWLQSYAFPMEIIEEACNRTVSAVENNRFAYAEKILASWNEKNVRSTKDIEALDSEFLKSKGIPEKKNTSQGSRASQNDSFNRFEQRSFDYDSIEHLLTGTAPKNSGLGSDQ